MLPSCPGDVIWRQSDLAVAPRLPDSIPRTAPVVKNKTSFKSLKHTLA